MCNAMGGGGPENFDKDAFKDMMVESLSLSELKKYAEAESVDSFYYTLSVSFEGKCLLWKWQI